MSKRTTPTTELPALIVVPGTKGPKVHKITCKRYNASNGGHSYGADPADVHVPGATCCKPKLSGAYFPVEASSTVLPWFTDTMAQALGYTDVAEALDDAEVNGWDTSQQAVEAAVAQHRAIHAAIEETVPLVRLTKRTGFQTQAAAQYLEADRTTGSTIEWDDVTAPQLLDRLAHVLADGTVTDKGERIALHSVRRALEALVEATTEADAAADAVVASIESPDDFLDVASALLGGQSLEQVAAARTTDPEVAAQAAAITEEKGTSTGGVRSPNAHPRLAAAKAAMKAKDNKKADGAVKMTDAELTDYMRKARAEHPDTNRTAELEYAYWVANISVGRLRWNGLWDALVAADGATAAA